MNQRKGQPAEDDNDEIPGDECAHVSVINDQLSEESNVEGRENIPEAGSGSKSSTDATAVKLIGPKMCGNLSDSEMPGAGDPAAPDAAGPLTVPLP